MTKEYILEVIVFSAVKQGRRQHNAERIFGKDSEESRLELAKWEALYGIVKWLDLESQYRDKLIELKDVSYYAMSLTDDA